MRRILWSGGVLAVLLAGCNPPTTKAPDQESAANTTENTTTEAPEAASEVKTPTTTLKFTSQPQKLEAGKPATWRLQIVDAKSNEPVKNFDVVHDKLLHLIVVSKDLSWFNHIHPEHRGNGVFEIKTTVPRAGEFKIFADYTPEGGEQEIGKHTFTVAGANPLPSQAKLTPDQMRSGWMTKQAKAHDEGAVPAANAGEYQIALMPMPAQLEANKEVMLHFQVRDKSGKPVSELQPYLGAKGHLVVLSGDGETFLHAHPMDDSHSDHPPHPGHEDHAPSTPPSDVMFHTEFPTDGIYKAWAQFKHNNKIITAPFVLKVGSGNTNTPTNDQASTPANAQKVTVNLPMDYKDNVATVKAGQPVALTFHLKEEGGCGNDVAVPAAKWRKKLKVGESATVVYTPRKTGTLKFACTMDMMRGSLRVQ